MLKALVGAAESRLETKISSVAVTVYYAKTVNYDATKAHVVSALNRTRITSHDFLDHFAVMAAHALGITSSCRPEMPKGHQGCRKHPEQLVLSVEFAKDTL
jgi:hypothetical protein